MESYSKLAEKEVIEETIKNLTANNIKGIFVASKEGALAKIKELIPAGAAVMNGASRTLEEIGFIGYLQEGRHGWNNLHDGILAEKDPVKQAVLRKQAVLSDYYLGSVHALSQTGEFVIASNTGSQLSHITYTSPHLIFVVGAQKIVPTIEDGLKRLQEHVIPMEDDRMMQAYGAHTYPSKILIFKKENPMTQRKVRVIIVGESLGF